jgi:hypothetical protein
MRFLMMNDNDCELALETLQNDSHSSAFDRDLRLEIGEALVRTVEVSGDEIAAAIANILIVRTGCSKDFCHALGQEVVSNLSKLRG